MTFASIEGGDGSIVRGFFYSLTPDDVNQEIGPQIHRLTCEGGFRRRFTA